MKLTKPQRAELKRVLSRPQHNCGAATVRLHNTLAALKLVEIREGEFGLDHAFITDLGRQEARC